MIHVDSVGTIFRWTIKDKDGPINISSASLKKVKFLKPDGSQLEYDLAFSTDPLDTGTGSDGRVEYTTIVNDIDQEGKFEWQLKLTINAWTDHTSKGSFVVDSILF